MSLSYLSKEDFYEVRLGSMLASYDREILTMLYQPILGYDGLALYFTLWAETKRTPFAKMNKHVTLCNELQMECSLIYNARKKLEGLGLLKTYKEKINNENDNYIYELYAPKSPEDFFNDLIFKGLLSKKVGDKEVERLALIFASTPFNKNDYEEVTKTFNDVFFVEEDESLKVINVKTKRGRKTINIANQFDFGELLNELKKTYSLSSDAFTPDDEVEIKRLATLFGIDVLAMSEIVFNEFDANNEPHLNYDNLYKTCMNYSSGINIILKKDEDSKGYNADDAFGKALNLMVSLSPFEYLKMKQGYTNPAPSDINIINILSKKYGFNNEVINALIDYTLIKCDDTLPQAYIEKVAATLKRKRVTTALSACNALNAKAKKVNEENCANNETIKKDDDDVDELLKLTEGL